MGEKKHWPVAAAHESTVQGLPSSQTTSWLTHAPVGGSQAAVVQALPSLQTTGVPHIPAMHMLPIVQALPSSQGSPSGTGAVWHWPVARLQVSLVHGLPSSHSALDEHSSRGVTSTPTPGSFE